MTAPYRLPLADLHAAAPGVLGAIAHFDGDFPEAPIFHPPLWDGSRWVWDYDWNDAPARGLTLDLRIPTVAARLAGLCAMALDGSDDQQAILLAEGCVGASYLGMTEDLAVALAALTLRLAPRIAALRGGA